MGPELVASQTVEISDLFLQNKIRRAESGDLWLALLFSRDRTLFFSWDPEFYGCCLAAPGEIRSLSELASSRPPLLGAIKSHLYGAELVGSYALKRDRIMIVEFSRALGAGIRQSRQLLLEASGRYSNLMILDEDDKIIEASRHIYPESNRYRSIIPGRPYEPPPPIDGIAPEDFSGDINDLDRIAGFGRPLIEAVKKKYGKQGESLTPEIISAWGGNHAPKNAIYQKLGPYVTLFHDLLGGASRIETDFALEAARECVILPLVRRLVERTKKKVRTRLEQLARSNSKKIAESESLIGNEAEAETLMRWGRLILANIDSIPRRASEAELTEWTEEGGITRKIPLDPQKDAPQNAERYFARYKKKRAATQRAQKILPALRLERDELLDQSVLLECNSDAVTISMMMDELSPARKAAKKGKARTQIAPPHRRYDIESSDAMLLVGLSSKGNHYVTFRLADGGDIWLHAQGVPGGHVILRFAAKPDEDAYAGALEIAAAAAAFYSKARESGRVRVDYTERKHVRAITGAGLAQVTYKDFSTIIARPSLWEEAGLEFLRTPAAARKSSER
jgi:predicted ribosome quality control (RQC) complex YloA/Tae2 family protein